jgi:5'-nucleotidase
VHLLITNDDGIYAKGIRVLAKELSMIAKITLVAPDRERSATGHAITVHYPLRVEPVSVDGAADAYAVDGTPSDCVKLSLEALLPDKPTMVISGINRGPNLGTDILYSGTVSAAVEGIIHGVPSFAISLDCFDDGPYYDVAAAIAKKVVLKINEHGLPPGVLLNINVPTVPTEKLRGIKITTLGTRRYRNVFDKRVDPRGRTYYWLAGDVIDLDDDIDTDTMAVKDGFVSITPVHFDLTDYRVMEQLKNWDLTI